MANPELVADSVQVSMQVPIDVAATFQLFTERTDDWWPRGPRFRVAGTRRGALYLEPRMHGRLFESFDAAGVTRVVRTGRILEWEPPARLAFDWRSVELQPGELTRVEVTFQSSGDETSITVMNRGWSALHADHPARSDLTPEAFLRSKYAWWNELLTSLRQHAASWSDGRSVG